MKPLFIQKLEKLKLMLLNPVEFKKEIQVRINGRKVLKNYKKNIDVASFPSVVLLVVNEVCNQRCRVCDLGRRDESSFYYLANFKDKGNMSKETFKSTVRSVKDFKSELWFLATEPLLYPDLFWAIEYASSFMVDTQLTTNGYLLPELAKKLVQAGIKRICLSIDGHCAKVHDYIRDCPGSYERAIDGLKKLIETKKQLHNGYPRIFINTVISQWNYDSLEKIVESLIKYDIEGINLSHLQFLTEETASVHTKIHSDFPIKGRNISCNDRNKINAPILYQQLKMIKQKYKKFRINMTPNLKNIDEILTYYFYPDRYIEGYRVCYMPWRYPHILANGDTVVNYECFGKSMGNINEQDLLSIWNGEKFRSFRQFIIKNNGSTSACWRCPMVYCGYKL